jgi:hypothetical protein
MKSLLAIVASVFAVTAFAADVPAKKEEAKPAVTAKAATPAKSEAKTAPTKEVKAAK